MRHPRSALLIALSVSLAAPAALAFKRLEGDGAWPVDDGPVEYWVSNIGSDDIPDDSDTRAIEYAFRSWECVLCSNIQFRNMGSAGDDSAMDGKNVIHWAEDAAKWQAQAGADIVSTLGVCQHYNLDTYSEADIIFNGAMHTWSTDEQASATDVESVAIHETGHFLGLAHSCTDQQETDCIPAQESVMNPQYPGGILRDPRQDDQEGICAIYPTPKASCGGKKRLKEACEKDCDCEPSLYCVPDDSTGARMCSRTCGGTNDKPCPRSMGCVLGLDSQGERGMCLRTSDDNTKRAGMACSRDSECADNRCERAGGINRLICVKSCTADADCGEGYRCNQNACVLPSAASGVPCPDEDPDEPTGPFPLPPGCSGCSAGPTDGTLWALGLLMLARARRRGSDK